MLGSGRMTDLLAVDFTDDHLKLVHAKPLGRKVEICNVDHQRIESGSEDDYVEHLRRLVKRFKAKSREVICVVPARSFISKNVDMPSMDREEIRKIVDLQANRYTPYSRDEIVFDHICVDTPGQHYTNVLLIIMNRKLVEKYCRIIERAGFGLSYIRIASEGMASAYREIAKLDAESDSIGGIHIDSDNSDFMIIDRIREAGFDRIYFEKELP